jgi:hypothetical protein
MSRQSGFPVVGLEGLERSLRTLRVAALLPWLLVAVLAIGGATRPANPRFQETVEARRVLLRDSRGTVRGGFAASDSGTSLVMNASDGSPRMVVAVDKDGLPNIILFGAGFTPKLELTLKQDGEGSVNVYGEEKRQSVLTSDALILKKESSLRALINAREDSSVTLFDAEGRARAVLGSISLELPKTGSEVRRAASSLVLFDKQGKVVFEAPAD